MATFEQLSVKVSRVYVTETSSTSVMGLEASSSTKETTKLTMTLPRATPVQAEFSREGFGDKIVKLFKRELQTGDKDFDDAVYIATETPESTADLLANSDVRLVIRTLLECGPIQIKGQTVTTTVPGKIEGDDADTVQLVAALLA